MPAYTPPSDDLTESGVSVGCEEAELAPDWRRAGLKHLEPGQVDLKVAIGGVEDAAYSSYTPPQRFVIDFAPRDVVASQRFQGPFAQVEERVLPARKEAAAEEKRRNAGALAVNPKAKVNRHHENFLRKWWQLSKRATGAPAARVRSRKGTSSDRTTSWSSVFSGS